MRSDLGANTDGTSHRIILPVRLAAPGPVAALAIGGGAA
jgi:hypothetical protein